MFQRRFIHILQTLTGRAFWGRNTHNSAIFWKRALVFFPWYALSLIMALLDLLFAGYLFTGIMRITRAQRRKLSESELALFANLPEERAYLRTIDVCERSWMARLGAYITRRKSLGLGLGNTIHFSRNIDSSDAFDRRWLVHEIAHTLQFKYRGLIYIPEALIAQQFSGYSFGGKETICAAKHLRAFNPEQQADMFVMLQLSQVESDIRGEIERGRW